MRKRIRLVYWIWTISLSWASSSSSSSPRASFDPQVIRAFVRSRCNGGGIPRRQVKRRKQQSVLLENKSKFREHRDDEEGCAIWIYEGALVDPSNGRTLAQVQGLELVRHLTECYNYNRKGLTVEPIAGSSNSNDTATTTTHTTLASQLEAWRGFRGLQRLGNLAVKEILIDKANQNQWDYAATILSRKLFCYMTPPPSHSQDKEDDDMAPRQHVLSSFRMRPTSPVRNIPIQQATALYDTATTFISCNQGRDLWIHTEFPDGRWCLGSASGRGGGLYNNNKNNNNNFDFQVYVRASSPKDKPSQFIFQSMTQTPQSFHNPTQHLMGGIMSKWKKKKTKSVFLSTTSTSSSTSSAPPTPIIISPPRSKIFQWGRDSFMDQLRRYGSSRETYSYSMEYPKVQQTNSTQLLQYAQQSLSTFTQNVIHHGIVQPIQIFGERVGLWDYDDSSSLSLLQQHKRHSSSSSSSSSSTRNFVPDLVPPVATKCSLRYTRFGESPPWYGVGRMCTLELMGRKVSSSLEVPPLVARIAATQIPGFMSVHTSIPNAPIVTEMVPSSRGWKKTHVLPEESLCSESMERQVEADQGAIRAVTWFRGKEDGSIPLQIVGSGEKL